MSYTTKYSSPQCIQIFPCNGENFVAQKYLNDIYNLVIITRVNVSVVVSEDFV